MMFDIITILLVGAMLIFASYTAFHFVGRHPKRTVDEVAPFLRPAEAQELESLLDPGQETSYRLRLSSREFAGWQRKRIHLMREYLLRMSHNALVLIEWGNMETFAEEARNSDLGKQKQLLAQELVQAATEFRLYSLLALIKLKFWLLLPSLLFSAVHSPSLPRLRNVFGISALGSYARLKRAAGSLSLVYSRDLNQDLLARL